MDKITVEKDGDFADTLSKRDIGLSIFLRLIIYRSSYREELGLYVGSAVDICTGSSDMCGIHTATFY